MSATNRGSKREAQDLYSTPESAFKPLIPYLPKTVSFWEPAAGDGRLIKMLRKSGREAWGCDLNHGFNLYSMGEVKNELEQNKSFGQDFLADFQLREFIITNPPFSLAEEFVRHSLEVADETMMLLRLNFLGSSKRRDWFRAHEPNAMFVITPRPSFVNGGSDACEYMWTYWGTRYSGIYHP